jgi:signal transduction histidine kinase
MNIAATVFAIIDEAVTNARKHARNAPIFVSAQRRDNTLVATIRDEGVGFDPNRVFASYDSRTSLGLQNMRDRAMLINGDLRIESVVGRGTRITLVVPLPPPSSEAS